MTTITLRAVAGRPLTNNEVDDNFNNLNTYKVEQTSATGAAALPSGTTAQRPASPVAGNIRYNASTGKFEGYGSAWGNIGGGAAIGDTAPSNPGAGDLWWNSLDGHLYVYYSDVDTSQWVDAFAGGEGQYLPLTGGTISGNLGIGTTSVLGNSQLNVLQGVVARNSGATLPYFQTYNANAGTDLKTWRFGGNSSGAFTIESVNDAYSSATGRVMIDASGNILFGNTAFAYGARGLFYAASAFNTNTYNPLELGSASGATVNHQLQKTAVSTATTVILSTGLYASLVVVFGSDGTNRFLDLVLFGLGNGAVGVVSSFSVSGTPAGRTYSQSSSTYRLAMASGTYTVQAYAISMNG